MLIVLRVLMVLRVTERKREKERGEGEKERERERKRGERESERKRESETPNTYALAQTTLEITIGCLCRGPSRRFQGACRFGTHEKNLPNGQTPWSVFQDGSNETDRRCSKWPPLARTHAKHL